MIDAEKIKKLVLSSNLIFFKAMILYQFENQL